MSEEWDWRLASSAQSDFDGLPADSQEQITNKLDEICSSPWREPPDYGEPLQNTPFRKIRIGTYRLSVTFLHEEQTILVARIKERGGAYTADD
jgi:mRNA-degrading endonuclease RelE of RelBE toxin-antitoxin system